MALSATGTILALSGAASLYALTLTLVLSAQFSRLILLPVCVHGLVQFKITCNIPHTLTSVKIEWLDNLGESWALLGGDRIYDTPAVVGRTASSRALGSATQPGTGCGVQFVRSAGRGSR